MFIIYYTEVTQTGEWCQLTNIPLVNFEFDKNKNESVAFNVKQLM